MQQRYSLDPNTVKTLTTDQLRQHFLIESLFTEDAVNMVYSHISIVVPLLE